MRRIAYLAFAAFVLGAAPQGGGTEALGPARSAQSFVDSVGVNVHLAYRDTAYGNFPAVAALIEKLGVDHVRDAAALKQEDVCREDRQLAARGVRFTYVTWPGIGAGDLAGWATCVGPAIEAYEGANEYDISHPAADANWVATVQNAQKRLYADVKGNASLASLPVVGPSFSTTEGYRAAGDLSAYLDRGNMHDYLLGQNPGVGGWGDDKVTAIAYNLRDARIVSGSKPIESTETGYGTSGSAHGIDVATQAKYVPRVFLEQFNAGVARTFEYELIDEGGPPYDAYGLVMRDLKPKPSYIALSSLLAILRGSGSGAAKPGAAPQLSLSGETTNVHHTLLERNGSYYVALWIEAMGFDPSSRVTLAVRPQHVVLHAAKAPQSVALYAYGADYALHESAQPAKTDIPLRVTDTVTVVKLRPHV